MRFDERVPRWEAALGSKLMCHTFWLRRQVADIGNPKVRSDSASRGATLAKAG
jgi:hypothetical protein